MNWDDLRFVLALATAGSLAKAARALEVDHTTVGRRIDAAEAALGVRLFTRTTKGYVPTADAERLLAPMKQVENAVLAVERGAVAQHALEGPLRVTSPESFGAVWLAPRLAAFGQRHPGLSVELLPVGALLDLARREAEVAVRFFRARQASLVVRKVGEVAYGFYASKDYLAQRPLKSPAELAAHRILSCPHEPGAVETAWLRRLNPRATVAFTSALSLALLAAARASAGVAILPRYLGDGDAALRHVPMPDPPAEGIWLTAHKDLVRTPRVRALLDHLAAAVADDAKTLRGPG